VKVLLDLNVLLDVLQRREPHYAASAAVLSRIAAGEMEGAVPGHALTTLYYVLFRLADRKRAIEAVDWLLAELEIVPEGREVFLRARSLDMDDFEDAVVAAAAEARGCTRIVTRNVADFEGAPVPAVSPRELDAELA
jgi:predicted nucleic acid-binding protein